MMTRDERNVIRDFANKGGEALRERAIEIYRRRLREPLGPIHGNPFYDFMRETDNGVPDLALRYRARRAVLLYDGEQTPQGRVATGEETGEIIRGPGGSNAIPGARIKPTIVEK